MAESVDALVSNTSGAIHPGSIPGLGTRSCKFLLVALSFANTIAQMAESVDALVSNTSGATHPEFEGEKGLTVWVWPESLWAPISFTVAYLALFVCGVLLLEDDRLLLGIPLLILSIAYWIAGIFLFCGLKVLKPQEALVLTLFGDYVGTLKGQGFYWVNPFCAAVNPAAGTRLSQSGDVTSKESGAAALLSVSGQNSQLASSSVSKKISLKMMTLNNSRQKINDCLGNPVEIGIAVIWRVTDTAKAVFNVDNYKEYLSLQCDSALRNVVRVYPYDVAPNVDTTGDGVADEGSLRGSSEVVAARIRDEIQKNVAEAGIEVVEARITYLAYAPEIAAVMLQRQQASAIIDARKMIVDGAVGMVEMALDRLSENKVVELDDERKAAMVSNLLVVLCGNRDAQPIVNSGSLY